MVKRKEVTSGSTEERKPEDAKRNKSAEKTTSQAGDAAGEDGLPEPDHISAIRHLSSGLLSGFKPGGREESVSPPDTNSGAPANGGGASAVGGLDSAEPPRLKSLPPPPGASSEYLPRMAPVPPGMVDPMMPSFPFVPRHLGLQKSDTDLSHVEAKYRAAREAAEAAGGGAPGPPARPVRSNSAGAFLGSVCHPTNQAVGGSADFPPPPGLARTLMPADSGIVGGVPVMQPQFYDAQPPMDASAAGAPYHPDDPAAKPLAKAAPRKLKGAAAHVTAVGSPNGALTRPPPGLTRKSSANGELKRGRISHLLKRPDSPSACGSANGSECNSATDSKLSRREGRTVSEQKRRGRLNEKLQELKDSVVPEGFTGYELTKEDILKFAIQTVEELRAENKTLRENIQAKS